MMYRQYWLLSRYGEEEIVEKLDGKRKELVAAISNEAAKDRYRLFTIYRDAAAGAKVQTNYACAQHVKHHMTVHFSLPYLWQNLWLKHIERKQAKTHLKGHPARCRHQQSEHTALDLQSISQAQAALSIIFLLPITPPDH